jgi:hypothetical protein
VDSPSSGLAPALEKRKMVSSRARARRCALSCLRPHVPHFPLPPFLSSPCAAHGIGNDATGASREERQPLPMECIREEVRPDAGKEAWSRPRPRLGGPAVHAGGACIGLARRAGACRKEQRLVRVERVGKEARSPAATSAQASRHGSRPRGLQGSASRRQAGGGLRAGRAGDTLREVCGTCGTCLPCPRQGRCPAKK